MHKIFWDFVIKMDYVTPVRKLDLVIINKEKRTLSIVELTVPADHKVKIKESENRDMYLDLVRELRKWCIMSVTVIPIVAGALGTVTKRLERGEEILEIRGRIETIQTIALFRSAWILRKVLETWRNLLSLRLQWKPSPAQQKLVGKAHKE